MLIIRRSKLYYTASATITPVGGRPVPSRGRTIRSENHNLINSLWNEELPEDWKESIIVPIYKMGDETDYSTYTGISFCQLPTKFYSILCSQG